MRAWLTRRRLLQIGAWVALLFLAVEVEWTPTAHDVQTPGATAIAGVRIAVEGTRVHPLMNIRPTTSLSDFRCQIWQALRDSACPDDKVVSLALWPREIQSPKTLYVAVTTDCAKYVYVYGFNIEYMPPNRSLAIHCYSAAPWVPIPVRVGCGACPSGPSMVLVVVPTDAISAGALTVIRDDRIEHLLGDQSTEVKLGTVTVP